MSTNAFIASAKKSKRAQTDIEKPATAIETGESITALVRRLIEDELG